MKTRRRFNSLYWKLATLFFLVIASLGFVYVLITTHYFSLFFEEVNQRINKNTAANIVAHARPFRSDGSVDEGAMEQLFRQIVSVNPNLEVYLLDTVGSILYFNTDESQVELDKVSLQPVQTFISKKGRVFVRGDDPRQRNAHKVFSAAPVYVGSRKLGYLYVMLESDIYNGVSKRLERNFFIRVGAHTMLLALLIALAIGLLLLRVIMNNFTRIFRVMEQFREGDLSVRVPMQQQSDLREFAALFNETADIFERNIAQLKEVEELRSRLIANVSHDLRTPIVIIHGYLETLQMKASSLSAEERTHFLNKIEAGVTQLENLIRELFELSLLEAGQVKLNPEPMAVSELVSDLAESYSIEAERKGIHLQLHLETNLPLVYADIALIERVLQNLIDNAMKFTLRGGTITLATHRNGDKVEISVRDTGIGIKPEQLRQILSGFYKERPFSDVGHSTGLGLIIVKKILELHRSSLTITSPHSTSGTLCTFNLSTHFT